MEITNLTGLEKPATVLIEKIAEAIGGFARPWQMERVAKAEATAAIIKAENLTEIQQRAMERVVFDATVQQKNIESIADKATKLLNDTAESELLEQDWLRNFFDKSKNVSGMEMQDLWAKLLAQEANASKTISKRTINLIESFDKDDAIFFEILCQTLVLIPRKISIKEDTYYLDEYEYAPIIMSNGENVFFNNMGLTYGKLCHLESIGLIIFTKVGAVTQGENMSPFTWIYNDSAIYFEPTKNEKNVSFGTVILTKVGIELAKIVIKQEQVGFIEEILEKGKKQFKNQTLLSKQKALEKIYQYLQSKN